MSYEQAVALLREIPRGDLQRLADEFKVQHAMRTVWHAGRLRPTPESFVAFAEYARRKIAQ